MAQHASQNGFILMCEAEVSTKGTMAVQCVQEKGKEGKINLGVTVYLAQSCTQSQICIFLMRSTRKQCSLLYLHVTQAGMQITRKEKKSIRLQLQYTLTESFTGATPFELPLQNCSLANITASDLHAVLIKRHN